ncbi:hypothetical protein CBE01nite_34720 [Clostridium beijerinckii]|uniref:CopG family transcriptional regulator n=1 Tax=Clostridium beijerinckii TaxID=1520 RepID=A0AB74VFQ4_CLOBE|nr:MULTISPECIES: hypothetical protein [Clostridium]AVK48963.1 hypothetical protein AXY43_13525 [Clostridium sp. MF28]NOW08084.1 hypothetical protein [Clostridium beijerinckii]NRZ24386.1 hypothetical protein [Clostridium beijerinckii]NYB99395.1 hypothetical protein [Clostridium beijerinckii]NYC05640.1 hypothetical protein [Clostridium beijerinckii]
MALERFTCRLEPEVYDTLYRMKNESMIDASKITNKAVKEYLIANGYEIRLNTEEENEIIFKDVRNKKQRK